MGVTPTNPPHRVRQGQVIALAVICCALAFAACGSSSKSTTTISSSQAAAGLKFAECMRSHGVANFPDPTSDASAPTTPTAGTVDKQSPAFQSAQQACKSQAAAIAAASGKPRESAAAQLEYAECMRAHRVTNFPDPLPGGGFDVPSTVKPQSPGFVAADKACGGRKS